MAEPKPDDIVAYGCDPEVLKGLRKIARVLFGEERFKTDERRDLANWMWVLLDRIEATPVRHKDLK